MTEKRTKKIGNKGIKARGDEMVIWVCLEIEGVQKEERKEKELKKEDEEERKRGRRRRDEGGGGAPAYSKKELLPGI